MKALEDLQMKSACEIQCVKLRVCCNYPEQRVDIKNHFVLRHLFTLASNFDFFITSRISMLNTTANNDDNVDDNENSIQSGFFIVAFRLEDESDSSWSLACAQ